MRRWRIQVRRSIGQVGSLLSVTAALLLALAGLLGIGIGIPATGAAPTTLPPITYTACPAFTTLETDVNAVGSGQSQTITFLPGLDCSYNVADSSAPNYVNGQINVSSGASVTIDGNGLTIAGGVGGGSMTGGFPLIAVFTPPPARTSLTLDQTTLEFGAAGIEDYYGGPATIVVTNSAIKANEIGISAHGNIGASITVSNSLIQGNVNGGIRAETSQNANVTVTNSTISDNSDGIDDMRSYNPTISVTSSTLINNDEGYDIDAFQAHAPSIQVNASTLSYSINGIDVYDAPNTSVTVADSTISNNDDDGIDAAQDSSPTISLTSSTIADNYYGIEEDQGAGLTINLSETILADNRNRNCGEPVADGGYNISTDAYCGFSGTSRQSVSDSALDLQPLADNGGPTVTQALVAPSVAIDAIPVYQGQCTLAAGQVDPIVNPVTGLPITTDQRGVLRPQGRGCDVGAFELAYPLVSLPGNTTVVRQGFDALLRFYSTDSQGHDTASRNIKATSLALFGDGQTIPFAYPFQYGVFYGQSGYQMTLNTRNLAPGDWTMEVQVGSGAGAAYGWLTFQVE